MTLERYTPILSAPQGHCRGCGGVVAPPRRTWCSDRCVVEAQIRAGDGTIVRRELARRDRGVCARCRIDTGLIDRAIDHLRRRATREPRLEERASLTDAVAFLYQFVTGRRRRGRHLWEGDHVLPVIEGGGGCSLDGYRTLCIPCHVSVSAELAARRARARREQIAKARLSAWLGRSK